MENALQEVPPATARAIVLRHLPRPLRAGLQHDVADGPLPAELAADADAAVPGLGAEVADWIRAWSGRCPGLDRWPERTSPAYPAHASGPGRGGLAALDRSAATRDDAVLRDVADALVLIGAFDHLAPLAGRAAAAVWACLDRLPEAGATLHQLALTSAGTQARTSAPDVPWPDLGPDGLGPVAAADAETVDAAAAAWRTAIDAAFAELAAEARLLVIGLSAVAGGRPVHTWRQDTLAAVALGVGKAAVEPLTLAAARDGRRYGEERARHRVEDLQEQLSALRAGPADAAAADTPLDVPPGHVIVCPTIAKTGPGKGKELTRGYEHVVGVALPLVPVPDLATVRDALLPEFPYAQSAVDAVLGAFAGRPHVHAPPLLVVGPPGCGKSRFVRRVGAALGVGVHRVDGANDGGGSFGGTERRWYSSEPCKPFMAVARHAQANPLVLVDEIDKAPTRSDYGRLWDSMLQVLDPENARRFPDPSLQVELDLSCVTVMCTANSAAPLPGPLLDRMRIVRFPEPGAQHLDALLPGVLREIAVDAGLDPRFLRPPDGVERAALAARWRGGSVRRLRRAVEAVLRVRERALAGKLQ